MYRELGGNENKKIVSKVVFIVATQCFDTLWDLNKWGKLKICFTVLMEYGKFRLKMWQNVEVEIQRSHLSCI